MNNYTKGSLSLFSARVLSGLNVNAMGYLLPLWIAPVGCVTLRLVFGALVFWIVGIFAKPESVALKDKLKLFLLGGGGIFGYMSLYAVSLSHTTPVSFAIFNAMQPMWVVIASAVIFKESIDARKLMGIAIGFAGAMLCILSEPNHAVADNPLFGNVLSIAASIIYAVYLVFSARMVGHLSRMTILRYTFLSAAVVALLFTWIFGFSAPLFEGGIKVKPLLVLAFVLIFPTVITYFLIPVGLKYLNSTVVAIYGYVTLIVASVVSFITGADKFEPVILLSLVLIGVSIYFVGIKDSGTKKKAS